MIRALWTAGQGMIAQQTNVDVISNNLANTNTTAFKKDRVEFKDLLYETLDRAYMLNGDGKPVNLQVGHGVAPVATVKNFGTGNLEKTENPLDFALEGDGFFTVRGPKGDKIYTKDGSFKLSITPDGTKLTTSDGHPVLDSDEQEIFLTDINLNDFVVSQGGELSSLDKNTGQLVSMGKKFGIVKFSNKQGLESIGGNFYKITSATGDPVADELTGEKTIITQRMIETSNVQVVEEMVNLIVAQRAYEINSKAIQTADDMLQTANSLKR